MAFTVDDTLSKNEQSFDYIFLVKQCTMLMSVITKMFISLMAILNFGVEWNLFHDFLIILDKKALKYSS